MPQMDLSMKQKQTHRPREYMWLPRREVYGMVEWEVGIRNVNCYIYRMDTQQGPTIQNLELYPVSCDKP